MITIVLTNRNRDLRIIKNSFESLQNQSNLNFEWFVVDYGSDSEYLIELEKLVSKYPKIKFISCPVSNQLWSKCRAINIALKQCKTPYFIVGDIDLIFHSNFIQKASELAKPNQVNYFQYGFLAKEESLLNKKFEDFIVDFKGNQEVTGTTMFPTDILIKLNGYDEFYHGWGAEDTDIQIRMINEGLDVNFYDAEILVKHQWHPKAYRSNLSLHPFHSLLERINHAYMVKTQAIKLTQVNHHQDWGKMPDELEYRRLEEPFFNFKLKPSILEINAIVAQFNNFKNEVIHVEIRDFTTKEKLKNIFKIVIGKKHIPIYNMEIINNFLLEEIIKNYRNCPYKYKFSRQDGIIELTINFTK